MLGPETVEQLWACSKSCRPLPPTPDVLVRLELLTTDDWQRLADAKRLLFGIAVRGFEWSTLKALSIQSGHIRERGRRFEIPNEDDWIACGRHMPSLQQLSVNSDFDRENALARVVDSAFPALQRRNRLWL